MTWKKIFMISFLSIYMVLILLFIINADDERSLLSTFIFTIPVVIIYMANYVKLFSTSFFFLLFYLMLFFIQPIYNLLVEYHYYHYSFETIQMMTVLAIVGILLYCIGNCLLAGKKPTLKKIFIEKKAIRQATILVALITFISIILCFIDVGTLNIVNLSRRQLNESSILRLFATYGLYTTSIMFFLVFFTVKARRRSNVLKWILIFIFLEILIFMLFRTRSLLVVHSAAVLVGYYYSSLYGYNKFKSRLSPKLITFTLGIGVFLVAIVSRFFRGFLQPGQSVSNFDFDLKNFLELSIQSGDIGYTTKVLDVINYVPLHHDFLLGQSYYRILFIGIPRSIWPDKPPNTQQIVADWLEPGVPGMSVPPGIIGDAYINFGVFGVLLLFFFGMFFALLDKKLSVKNFMLWAVSATWIFHLVRGGFTNPLLIFVMLFTVLSIINYKIFNKNTVRLEHQEKKKRKRYRIVW